MSSEWDTCSHLTCIPDGEELTVYGICHQCDISYKSCIGRKFDDRGDGNFASVYDERASSFCPAFNAPEDVAERLRILCRERAS